jgi:hypothetical protein
MFEKLRIQLHATSCTQIQIFMESKHLRILAVGLWREACGLQLAAGIFWYSIRISGIKAIT